MSPLQLPPDLVLQQLSPLQPEPRLQLQPQPQEQSPLLLKLRRQSQLPPGSCARSGSQSREATMGQPPNPVAHTTAHPHTFVGQSCQDSEPYQVHLRTEQRPGVPG